MKLYSVAQVAEATGKTVAATSKRAKNGRKNRKGVQTEAPWTPAGKDGKAALYALDALPKDVQAAFLAMEARTERQAEAERRKALCATPPAETATAVP